MKKITLLLLSLTLSTSLFIGCGSSTSSSTDDSSKPSTSQEGNSDEATSGEESSEKTSEEATNDTPAEPVAKDISIEEAKKLIADGEVTLILDVRTEKEYNEGHLENSIQIAVEDLKDNLADIEKFKDQLVLVYCKSGNRSGDAMNILKENGFTNLVHMKDGISAWDGEIIK
ncbi:rhodanese-like domain-containing protein [Clostridium sp. B9]|uniref:rhodanese-like domain-containing protein n=1 Tax=Clostridium sp. B9 TaxID=3423224 RepID=UPI003D2ECA81